MRSMQEIWRRLRWLAWRGDVENGLAEEIRFHVDQQIAQNLRAGMSAGEARRRALLTFGSMGGHVERTRDEFRLTSAEDVLRDLWHGVRALQRAPVFSAIACLTLALGIGAATAVFSVVNGVLLKPLPYPDPDALVGVWHRVPGLNVAGDVEISAAQFFTYREENRTFQDFGLWTTGTTTAAGASGNEEVRTLFVTHGTLQALGVPPLVGRGFTRQDDTPGAPETVLLTHGYWQRRFGGDPAMTGRSILVGGRPRLVIGVMPAHFRFLTLQPEVILPFMFNRADQVLGRFNYQALARLKHGVTVAEANADVARMLPIWLEAWPAPRGVSKRQLESARVTPALRPLKEDVVGDVGSMLWIAMGTVALVLLLACVNVANLVLVRAQGRQPELAVRTALGAGWVRIARGLLLEHLVLAAVSGALGVLIAFAAVRFLVALAPANLPRLEDVAIDPIVLAFASLIGLASGVAFGMAPLVRRTGVGIAPVLRGSRRVATEGPEAHRVRSVLVVVQVALALVLLVGSGLMVRTLFALRAVDAGFTDPDHVQLVRISIAPAHVAEAERVVRLLADMRERLAALPRVAAASFANAAPLEPYSGGDAIYAEDRTYAEGAIPEIRRFKFVAPGFFASVGTRFVAGRDFTWAELHQKRAVAVVSESVAREMWQGAASAIGKRIRENAANPWREIVGVVADVHDDGLHLPARPIVYWPALVDRFGSSGGTFAARVVTFAVRSERAGTEGFIDEIRRAIAAADANVPLAQVRTLRMLYDASLARTSFTLVTLGIAAATALLLGVIGIYGSIAYIVAQRTREIGVRLALGARPDQIRRTFVRQGLMLATVGIGCGLAAAAGLARFMTSLLYGISPVDAPTYAAVAVVLLVAAAVSSYLPARRATIGTPMHALRSES